MLNTCAPLSEDDAKYIFEQLVSALEYLHSKGISHGDVKLENIICSDDMKAKLIDFGFSSEENIQTEYRGSVNYCAPEILSLTPFNGKEADMWSAGVCLFAMVSGCLPFYEENIKDTIHKVKKRDFKIPEFVSNETKHMINSLLQYQSESRMTASEVLKDKWMRYEDDDIYMDQLVNDEIDIPIEKEY
jgi:5'-AMP-activated protein kinase catalytic alpha subunit